MPDVIDVERHFLEAVLVGDAVDEGDHDVQPRPKRRVVLAEALDHDPDPEALLALLDDTEVAVDDALPSTGVGRDWERRLSSLRIVGDGYGTRSSTALVVGVDGDVSFVERSFDEGGGEAGVVRERFSLDT